MPLCRDLIGEPINTLSRLYTDRDFLLRFVCGRTAPPLMGERDAIGEECIPVPPGYTSLESCTFAHGLIPRHRCVLLQEPRHLERERHQRFQDNGCLTTDLEEYHAQQVSRRCSRRAMPNRMLLLLHLHVLHTKASVDTASRRLNRLRGGPAEPTGSCFLRLEATAGPTDTETEVFTPRGEVVQAAVPTPRGEVAPAAVPTPPPVSPFRLRPPPSPNADYSVWDLLAENAPMTPAPVMPSPASIPSYVAAESARERSRTPARSSHGEQISDAKSTSSALR